MKEKIKKKSYLCPNVFVICAETESILTKISGQHSPINYGGQSGDAKQNPFSSEAENEDLGTTTQWGD